MARDVRRPGRWDDDRSTPRPRRFVDGDRVIGGVSGDAHERALDRGEQIEGGGRIIPRRLGQRVDEDRAGLIDAKVELPPATPAAATVFRGRPLTCPDDGQPRAVEHEMEALAGRDRSQTTPQMLTAPGERRIVGGGEVEAHHPEQGVQEPFGLAQREMVEEQQGHGGLDGKIRVPPLPTPPAAPAGHPGSDRFRGQPHRHIAASNEGPVIGRPVRNAVLRLVRGMDLRLHPCSVAPAEGPEKCGPRRPTRNGYSCNNAARHHGAEVVKNLMVDAKTTSRWYFVIAMGRSAGHLALGIGKAAGATLTLIPEEFAGQRIRLKTFVDTLVGAIIKRLSYDRRDGVAIIAEGLALGIEANDLEQLEDVERDAHGNVRIAEVNIGEILKAQVQKRLGHFGIKTTIAAKNIGYELRCADPIPSDMEYTRDLGYCAAKYLLSGGNAVMISMQGGNFIPIPFADLIDRESGVRACAWWTYTRRGTRSPGATCSGCGATTLRTRTSSRN